MTTAYIIPGYTENAKDVKYKNIKNFFESAWNVEAKIVHIDWKYKTMSDYVQQFLDQYEKHKGKIYIQGFSYGAMIAAIAQQEAQADQLLLCSLSPYFKEDLPRITKWWKTFIGKRRVEDFQHHAFSKIAKHITCKTHIIAGDAEGPEVLYRAKHAKKLIQNSTLHILPGVKHDIADPRYQQKVQEIITKMVQ